MAVKLDNTTDEHVQTIQENPVLTLLKEKKEGSIEATGAATYTSQCSIMASFLVFWHLTITQSIPYLYSNQGRNDATGNGYSDRNVFLGEIITIITA